MSNPPYIAHEDMDKLPAGVRDFEPHLALDGGPGGFAVFDRLIDEAPTRPGAGGYLLVEIGAPQEEKARQHITQNLNFDLTATIHDYSGHPRVLKARRR